MHACERFHLLLATQFDVFPPDGVKRDEVGHGKPCKVGGQVTCFSKLSTPFSKSAVDFLNFLLKKMSHVTGERCMDGAAMESMGIAGKAGGWQLGNVEMFEQSDHFDES